MIEVPNRLVLSEPEARVLGVLMEKRRTTPDAYPMTLKSVTTACNQSTSRDPVVNYDEYLVDTTLGTLKAKAMVRMVHPGAGERSTKFRHVADDALGLDDAATAVLCVLLLRGPQTAAELKTRTERIHRFDSIGATEEALQNLADHERRLAVQLERLPGHKERRWQQQLTVNDPVTGPSADHDPVGGLPGATSSSVESASSAGTTTPTADLEARVDMLEQRLERLIDALGDLVDPADVGGD